MLSPFQAVSTINQNQSINQSDFLKVAQVTEVPQSPQTYQLTQSIGTILTVLFSSQDKELPPLPFQLCLPKQYTLRVRM